MSNQIPTPMSFTPQKMDRVANFFPSGDGLLLPCSTTSGSTAVAFPVLAANISFANDILVYNDSSTVDAFIAWGSSAITAAIPISGTPANGILIAPGAYLTFNKGNSASAGQVLFVAGLTASSTANVYIYQGYGA